MNRMIRRFCVLLGVGVAVATLASPAARAQENVQRSESYYRNDIYNYGLPRNHHQAPSLGLGNIYGLNPCATGVSVGATMPLFGIGGAFSTIDEECQLRNNVALTVSALKDEALAREIMCNVEAFRAAAIRIGRPCIRDGGQPIALTQGSNPETATSSQLMPVPSAGLPPNALPPVPPAQAAPPVNGNPAPGGFRGAALAAPRPAFCEVPGLNTAVYPECSGARAETAAPAAPAAGPRRPPLRIRAPEAPRPGLLPPPRSPEAARPLPPPARAPEAGGAAPAAVLGRADGSPDGCASTPAAIQALFAECVAAARQAAMAAARRARPAPEPAAATSLAAR
jgi:hypothetical protein